MVENCFSYIPSVEEYFAAYSTVLIVLLVLFTIIWFLVGTFYALVVRDINSSYEKHCRPVLIFANGIYLVVVTFSIVSLIVPIASEKLDLASYIIFSWCIFAFYRYIRLIGGGHNELRKIYESGNKRLATGKRLQRLLHRLMGRYIVIRFCIVQFPILTTVISTIQIVFLIVDNDLYYSTSSILLPFSLISIIVYLLAFFLLIISIESSFPDPRIKRKFQLLRLVVLVLKIQVSILEIIFPQLHFECDTFAGEARSLYNFVKQSLIVAEITLLAFATWTVYRKAASKNAMEGSS
ncbi:uncharacterized protein LOC131684788 isoform X3 [Topomyia yanbarensis]|uniref:uncharacterized protein LOC131684788 isoform X3 n=1 Tax=Topomyia yanbarensis TaxID=2498891 RepID=UPI00273CAC01|nr:uncharacterized protein LOC131684788 isoform X3 [Topomyia yanbarensis]